jgi:hypothetical protein
MVCSDPAADQIGQRPKLGWRDLLRTIWSEAQAPARTLRELVTAIGLVEKLKPRWARQWHDFIARERCKRRPTNQQLKRAGVRG